MEVQIYHYLFKEHIEGRLRAGGNPEHVVALAKIYENEDPVLHYAFREWLRDQTFDCSRCGRRFRQTDDSTDEFSDVICAECRKRFPDDR